jgi:hypothetical protein
LEVKVTDRTEMDGTSDLVHSCNAFCLSRQHDKSNNCLHKKPQEFLSPLDDMDRVAMASEGEGGEIWTRLREVANKIEPFLASDILFASPCGWKPFTLHKRR